MGGGTNNGIATAAATNKSDWEISSSTYGACVDLWAPGASILSMRKGGGTTTMSGIVMEAPHLGGGGGPYLPSNTGASVSCAENALTSSVAPANTTKGGSTITREYVSGLLCGWFRGQRGCAPVLLLIHRSELKKGAFHEAHIQHLV